MAGTLQLLLSLFMFNQCYYGILNLSVEIFYNYHVVAENYSNLVMKAAETYQAMPLGSILANIEGTHIHQALKDYIHDFVQMKHFVTSDLEHQVCDNVFLLFRKTFWLSGLFFFYSR